LIVFSLFFDCCSIAPQFAGSLFDYKTKGFPGYSPGPLGRRSTRGWSRSERSVLRSQKQRLPEHTKDFEGTHDFERLLSDHFYCFKAIAYVGFFGHPPIYKGTRLMISQISIGVLEILELLLGSLELLLELLECLLAHLLEIGGVEVPLHEIRFAGFIVFFAHWREAIPM
jgi:hypothetical protein